jgi:hypothetical protein
MSSVKVQGNASGTGALTIAAPNTNTDRTLTLPDQTGTFMATGGGPINVSTSAAANSVVVDASGNFLVGTTSSPSASVAGYRISGNILSASATSSTGASTSAIAHYQFINGNGTVGQIYTTGSSTVFATSSDYRLKNTVSPMIGALAKVAALKPCTYKWNADGSYGEGFIAHELAEVVPQCVIGEKDAVDAEGNPLYQGIDTSFLVATLTAAIQELKADLDATKAELAALKGAQ